jgi:hypothetical protein
MLARMLWSGRVRSRALEYYIEAWPCLTDECRLEHTQGKTRMNPEMSSSEASRSACVSSGDKL